MKKRNRNKFSKNHAATATAVPLAGAGFASFTAPATKPAGNSIGFSPDLAEFPPVPVSPRVRELTPGEVRTMYGPARSLGGSEDLRVAMDNALEDSGVYGLMAHTLDLGQGVFPQFMGYGALQNISQNGLIRACIGTVADDMTREWIKLQREGADGAAEKTSFPFVRAGNAWDDTLPADEEIWRTASNGKHYQVETETGDIVKGYVGQPVEAYSEQVSGQSGEWDSEFRQEVRRNLVEYAMNDIANGKPEATIRNLRNDLEQFGGTNDVTIVRGNAAKGLEHIVHRHGANTVAHVLEAVANGEIDRFVPGHMRVHLKRNGYVAILSLVENGGRKTWLLTGFKEFAQGKETTGDGIGKVCTRHDSTHTRPILCRPDTGAAVSFAGRIEKILQGVKW